MANLGSYRFNFLALAFQLVIFMEMQIHRVICYQYKIGDLDAWGIPTKGNPEIYTYWSKYHTLKIGDSLLFLYPPSQDSVIQVTEDSYKSCNLKDPILYINNGNSVFNITGNGEFYFTSGADGHCEKNQKLHISVLSGNGSTNPPSNDALPEISPSYPTVFGGIPAAPNGNASSSSPTRRFSIFVAVFVGLLVSITTPWHDLRTMV